MDKSQLTMTKKTQRQERARLDKELARFVDATGRQQLWGVTEDALTAIELLPPASPATGLMLGYVQSGKTTAMTALMAAAADRGYSVVIALLGATNILLAQNADRIRRYLGIDTRSDYAWVAMPSPKGVATAKEIGEWLAKERVLFIPVLKNRSRIADLTTTLRHVATLQDHRVLIVDDEADQASLNTEVRKGSESKVYAAIDELRASLQRHAFIQYTATPYAPLLLDEEDPLFPRFVKFLAPGKGYTGGREFFIDHKDTAVRFIPAADEQASGRLPMELPGSLREALWSFVVGAALLVERISDSPPISMLVHSTHRNDVQERYHFLLAREVRQLGQLAAEAKSFGELPTLALAERDRLMRLGVADIGDDAALRLVRYVLKEIKLWLLNSATAVRKVDWNVSPIHLLVGGNKLDRGFTVEGLTVTYMNRPASEQIDTIEQRARAFGYRSEFLPYCQFFGSARTVKMLREIVYTEYDLRATMQDYVEQGRSIAEWSREIGLLIPGGAKPTRDAVIRELAKTTFGWHQLRRPTVTPEAVEQNWALCHDLGLMGAPLARYGRLEFRTLRLKTAVACDQLLRQWRLESYSPGWRDDELLRAFERAATIQPNVDVILMEQDAGQPSASPRVRRWTDQEGFINLFQGRDLPGRPGERWYPGDRMIGGIEADPERLVVQVHRVTRREHSDTQLLTLALHLGDREIVTKGVKI